MSDDVTRLRPWQVKDFPEEKRQAVIRAAAGAGKTVAQWLEPVIDAGLTGAVNLGPSERPTLALGELIQIATGDGLPRYLRGGAARQIAARLGIVPPHLRLPGLPAPNGGGEDDQARARPDPTAPAAAAPGAAGTATGLARPNDHAGAIAEQGERRSHHESP